MVSAAVPGPTSKSSTTPWLVGPRYDLLWFFASMAVPYAMALFYLAVGPGPNKVVVLGLYVAFQLLFNLPHNAQTWTLTVMEPAELTAHRARYWGSVVVTVALLGGTMALSPKEAWPLLNSLIIYWGYWHLIKQHFGFVRIYEMRQRVFGNVDKHLSRAVLYVGGLAPLVQRIASGQVQLDPGRGAPMTIAHPPIPQELATAWWTVSGVLLALYLGRQVMLRARGLPNAPLAVATIVSALFNFFVALQLLDDLIVGVAIMTVWHNIQYIGLVWFMSQNRARRQGGGAHLVKWAGQGRVAPYVLVLAVYAVMILAARVALPEPWGAFPITFVVALHYFHDSFIWKISSNPHLREELGLAAPKPAPG